MANPISTVTVASGTVLASPTGTYTVDGTVTVANPVNTVTVANPVSTVTVASGTVLASPTGTYTVAGSVTVANPVSTVTVANPISTVTVASGTVVATPTGTYTVAGTVTASPSGTYTVAGTVTASPSGTYTMTGSGTAGTAAAGVVSIQGINNGYNLNVSNLSQTGIVVNYNTTANVANNNTATMSYTVTVGKTLYLKGVIASSSGAPCKVIVDAGAGPTVYGVGFYSAAAPYLAINFVQPPAISASTVVNVKIQNNAGSAQDVYCTLMGEER